MFPTLIKPNLGILCLITFQRIKLAVKQQIAFSLPTILFHLSEKKKIKIKGDWKQSLMPSSKAPEIFNCHRSTSFPVQRFLLPAPPQQHGRHYSRRGIQNPGEQPVLPFAVVFLKEKGTQSSAFAKGGGIPYYVFYFTSLSK